MRDIEFGTPSKEWGTVIGNSITGLNDEGIGLLAKQYAERFDVDNGDTVEEYAERVAYDEFPYSMTMTKRIKENAADRNRLLIAVKAAIRELTKV